MTIESLMIHSAVTDDTVADDTVADDTVADDTVADNTVADDTITDNTVIDVSVIFRGQGSESISVLFKEIADNKYHIKIQDRFSKTEWCSWRISTTIIFQSKC